MLIEIYNWGRGTGKTTEVVKLMEENEEIYCILPSYCHKDTYPKNLQYRLIVFNSNKLYSNRLFRGEINKVVLDEGFAYRKDEIANLYYFLGSNHISVRIYGTI